MMATKAKASKAKLTGKQALFVKGYLVNMNATEAATRAGYAKKSAYVEGSRLLRIAKVAAAVAQGQAEGAKRNAIDADYVLTAIRDTMEHCTAAGEHSNPAAVLKGAELLGRHLAMFTDKSLVTTRDGDRLDDILAEIAEKGERVTH